MPDGRRGGGGSSRGLAYSDTRSRYLVTDSVRPLLEGRRRPPPIAEPGSPCRPASTTWAAVRPDRAAAPRSETAPSPRSGIAPASRRAADAEHLASPRSVAPGDPRQGGPGWWSSTPSAFAVTGSMKRVLMSHASAERRATLAARREEAKAGSRRPARRGYLLGALALCALLVVAWHWLA